MIIPKDIRLSRLFFRSLFNLLIPPRRWQISARPARFILICVWLFSIDIAISQGSRQDLESLFRAGQADLRQGNFDRAKQEFAEVLARDPALVEAEVNLGLAYQSLLDYASAAHTLAHALRARPDLSGVNTIVGLDYLKLGEPQNAAPYLSRALRLDPLSGDAHEAMALYDLTQDNIQGAAEQYRKVSDLDPDKPEALFKLGHQYVELSARLAYRGARLYPDSSWGHRFLADMLRERGRWEGAVREYQKALDIDPHQSGLHTLIGEAWLHQGNLENAETAFREELQLDSRYELAALGIANVHLAREHPLEALVAVDRVWKDSPEFLEVHPEFPSLVIGPRIAQASISRLGDAPEGPAKHYLLAALYASSDQSNRSDEEAKIFQRYANTRQRAESRAQAGRESCKLHAYSQCIAWLKNNQLASAHLLLGKAYFTLQQYEKAAAALALVHLDKNANSEASYWMERSYQALAGAAYSQLEVWFPDSWRTHQMRAESFALRHQRDDAIKEYETALRLNPEEAELHEALGEFYLDNRSDQDAQRELERAAALDPSRTKTLYLLGRLYVLGDENEKAVPFLRRALQLQPNLNEANELLGTAYVRLRKFEEAIPNLRRAATLDHYGNIHYQLYQAYRKLGQEDLAKEALARSQEIRQNSLEHDQAAVMGSSAIQSDSR